MSRCGIVQVGIASVFRWRGRLVICRNNNNIAPATDIEPSFGSSCIGQLYTTPSIDFYCRFNVCGSKVSVPVEMKLSPHS
jgi:hypothetical protein